MMAFSSTGSSSSTIHVPSASENVDRTWSRTSWLRANSTERSWSTFAPLAESSTISSYVTAGRGRAHLGDLRLAVDRVGDDSGLRAGERDRLVAEVVDGHRAERVRDPLADRDEHVVLARVGAGRDLVSEPDQLVGGVAHRREDAD